MEVFTHGEQIECPECPPFGKRDRRHTLEVLSTNYSGCSVDFGACPACGKAWQINYRIDKMTPTPDWNIPSRVQMEEEARSKKEEEDLATENKEWEEYERLNKKFGDIKKLLSNEEGIPGWLETDRTHEECTGCPFEYIMPPPCSGHPDGETACREKGKLLTAKYDEEK